MYSAEFWIEGSESDKYWGEPRCTVGHVASDDMGRENEDFDDGDIVSKWQKFDTLQEAITAAEGWARENHVRAYDCSPFVAFDRLSENELSEAAKVINGIIHDKNTKACYEEWQDKTFTKQNLKVIDPSSVTFEVNSDSLLVFCEDTKTGYKDCVWRVEGDTSDIPDGVFDHYRRFHGIVRDYSELEIPEAVDEPTEDNNGLDNQYEE